MTLLFRFAKIRNFYHKYERCITPVAFFGGFIFDHFTLRIDLWFQNAVFLLYLMVAGLSITFVNAYGAGRLRGRIAEKISRVVPFGFQFVFGGLFSAFLIFYSRSASLFASWPFLLFLALFFVGNEVLKKKYLHLTFQLSVFFMALFSYAVFALPLLLGQMGGLIFIASGALSLAAIGLIIFIFYRFLPDFLRQSRNSLILSIGGLYLSFQIFYFVNIIPPIPLSLKESGMYHSIEPAREGKFIYRVSYEPALWYLPFKEASDTFHWIPGKAVYSYTAIFAPTKFDLPVFHRWLYFDEEKKDWIETDRIRFPIIGGRDGGYRGYTFKENVHPAKWRVEVITERGQVLGRRGFKVVASEGEPELEIDLK